VATQSDRIEALRRLGVRLVVCSYCDATMREPPDPFQGPKVIWHTERADRTGTRRDGAVDDTLYYVCSSGCHNRQRAKLNAARKRQSTLKRHA
jgi:hypothetical protein